jgi:hypothetical protein
MALQKSQTVCFYNINWYLQGAKPDNLLYMQCFTSIFRALLIIISTGVGKDLAIGRLRWGGLCYLVRPVDKKYICIGIIIRGPK